LCPLSGIIQGAIKGSLSDPKGLSGNLDPALVEEFKDLVEPFAFFPEEIGQRHPDIAKGELGRRSHPDAHLGHDLRCFQAFGLLLNKNGALAPIRRLGIGIGLAEDNKEVGNAPVGDERLGPVDHEGVSLFQCCRSHLGDVASVIGFGIGSGGDRFPFAHRNEIFLLLLRCSKAEDHLG
jgi:hypothetical protein